MSNISRLVLLVVMLLGLVAFVAAPKAKTASTSPVMMAGAAPVPTCLPNDPSCGGPIIK